MFLEWCPMRRTLLRAHEQHPGHIISKLSIQTTVAAIFDVTILFIAAAALIEIGFVLSDYWWSKSAPSGY